MTRRLPLLLLFGTVSAMAADATRAALPEKHWAFFQSYCVDCHNADKQKGKMRLDDVPFAVGDIPTAERWQKILNVLNAGEMPPEEEKQPAAAEKTALLEDLSQMMVVARKQLSDQHGVITLRRLNRREYQNTMHDLLGAKVDVKDLPKDGGGGTFDTVGKSLFFSSDQFEQYLALARKALDGAIATGPNPEPKKVHIEPEIEANKRITGIFRGYQMGGYRMYKQWKASKGRPPSDFGLVDEREMDFRKLVWDRDTPPYADYLSRTETETGAFLTVHMPNPQVGIVIPDEMPPGDYRIRARVGVAPKTPAARHYIEIGMRGERTDGAISLIACEKVTGTLAQPQTLEWTLTLPKPSKPTKADIGSQTKQVNYLGDRVIALRERQVNSRDAAVYRHMRSLEETGFGLEPALWVDWVEWEGPIVKQWPSAAHAEIFFKGAGATQDDAYAREIVARFAARAFRGKEVKGSYLDKLMGHHAEGRAAGRSFEDALKEPLAVILASPSFLYLIEPAAEKAAPRELTGLELANRLSYFLWSAPPDATLLALARSGELRRPAVLTGQVDRMLADARAWEFVTSFAQQWLHLERLDFFQFNHRLYPGFDDSVKSAARAEVFHTLATVLRDDLGLGVLLKSDFVVINDLLADYYGIPGVTGRQFRKVNVPAGSPRGGFLGMAAILAMGSDGERSSPVERGAWVMRKLLHSPPPPAPANVPQLSRLAGKLLPARELQSAHMEQPQCAQCHRKIDPIGYGLENFNAVGLWRTEEVAEVAKNNRVIRSKAFPIDPKGRLPDGVEFADYFGLRDEVGRREEALARGFIEGLVEYGLGRPFGFSDEQLAHEILTQARSRGLTPRAIIHALVASKPFRSK